MKKTRCKYKGFYVIEHNDLPKNFYLLTLINFEAFFFLLLLAVSPQITWIRLFYIEYQPFQIFSFRMINVYRMVSWLGQLMQNAYTTS